MHVLQEVDVKKMPFRTHSLHISKKEPVQEKEADSATPLILTAMAVT